MLLLILDYLREMGVHVPHVFFYASTRMLLASITCLILTIFFGPYFIRKLYAMKIGQPVRDESVCPQLARLHGKKKDTPTMGGVLILTSLVVSLFLWMDLGVSFTWILLLTTIFFGFVGGYDDYLKLKHKNAKGLSPKKKMIWQALFSVVISLYLLCPAFTNIVTTITDVSPPAAKNEIVLKKSHTLTSDEYICKIFVPFVKKPVLTLAPFLMTLFIFFMISGTSNAVNLTDGLDGLAAGCLIMVSFVFGFIAFLSNNVQIARYLHILSIENAGEIGIYLMGLSGALLGFLWYNGHPAQVFMGDTGSLAFGGILGVSSVLLKRELLLAIVGGIFVAETLSVIIQVLSYRYRNKRRVFLCAPLHHHFEYKGWPETKVVLRFWIVGLLLGMIGIASLKFQ